MKAILLFQTEVNPFVHRYIQARKISIVKLFFIAILRVSCGYSQDAWVAPGYVGLFDGEFSEKENPYVLNDVDIEPIFPGIFYCNPESNGDATFSQLSKNPHVQELQPNFLVQMRGDPLFHEQWQYMNDGRAGGKVDADIDAPEIWDMLTAQGYFLEDTPVVAVLDVGFSLGHEDWQKNQWLNHAEVPQNGVDDDLNGFIDDYQGWNFGENEADVTRGGRGHWHGTPICGIIGADADNSIGVRGVCPYVKVMPIRIGTDLASVIAAYGYVLAMRRLYEHSNGRRGAYIVATSASFGVSYMRPMESPLWCAVFDTLGKEGILSIAPAPNNPVDTDLVGDMPTNCESDYLITVTNTNRSGELSALAGWGETSIDLGAPGDGVFTIRNHGGYGTFGGTSAAAPHVAGAVALLHLMYPATVGPAHSSEEKAKQIKASILKGVDKLAQLDGKVVSGGSLNLYQSATKWLLEGEGYSSYRNQDLNLTLAPNPANECVRCQFTLSEATYVTLEWISSAGKKLVPDRTIFLDRGTHGIVTDIGSLPPGVYYVRLNALDLVSAAKLVKFP